MLQNRLNIKNKSDLESVPKDKNGYYLLSGAIFTKASGLQGIDFSNAHLNGAIFDDTNLFKANFTGADLRDAKIKNFTNINSANFENAIMNENTEIIACNIKKANFKNNKTMIGIKLQKCNLYNTVFEDANLSNAKFLDCLVFNSNFKNTILTNATFKNGNYKNNDYEGAIIDSIIIQNSNIKNDIDRLPLKKEKQKISEKINFKKCIVPTNIPEYKKMPIELFIKNANQYLVHFEKYKNVIYPIVTIPKGTILYNYAKTKETYSNINNENKILNYHLYLINELNESYDVADEYYDSAEDYNSYKDYYSDEESINSSYGGNGDINIENEDRKYFYPVPYAAFGITELSNKYNICNIVTTTEDIRLLCLITPSPLRRSIMFKSGKYEELECPLIDDKTKQKVYYSNFYTSRCKKNTYDLCLNKELMTEMNLQGSIAVTYEDSISISTAWNNLLKHESRREISDSIMRQLILKSCFSAADFQGKTSFPTNNRIFGIPEIVLCPLKARYLGTPEFTNKEFLRDTIEEKNYSYMSYQPVDIIPLSKLDETLTLITPNIVENTQCLLFHMYRPHMNSDFSYIRDHVSLADDILQRGCDDCVNFKRSYIENEPKYTVFESVLYNVMHNNWNISDLDPSVVTGGDSLIIMPGNILNRRQFITLKRKRTMKKSPSQKKQASKRKSANKRTRSSRSKTPQKSPKSKSTDYVLTEEEYNNQPSTDPVILTMVNNIPILRPNPNYKKTK